MVRGVETPSRLPNLGSFLSSNELLVVDELLRDIIKCIGSATENLVLAVVDLQSTVSSVAENADSGVRCQSVRTS